VVAVIGCAWFGVFLLFFEACWKSYFCCNGLDKLYTLLIVAVSARFTSTNAFMKDPFDNYNNVCDVPLYLQLL
jgi:hypothetical protein